MAAGVVLTRLFQHIDPVFSWNGSDLEVLVDPTLDLQATVVRGIEADAISVLILARPTNRRFHLYISAVQDRQGEADLNGVAEVQLEEQISDMPPALTSRVDEGMRAFAASMLASVTMGTRT